MNSSFVSHPSHAPYSVPAIQAFPDRLNVITSLFNPLRYRARYRNYHAFAKHVADAGAILTTVECAFGARPFEITDADNPLHVQVRTPDELWLKENLMNIGISRLPAGARYIATIDADLAFQRPDWAQETMQMLQHHPAVQMYSAITYLGPDHEPLHTMESFADRWVSGRPIRVGRSGVAENPVFYSRNRAGKAVSCSYDSGTPAEMKKNQWGQPGGAWAYRREALDMAGGLLDACILGSADSLMAYAMIGLLDPAMKDEGYDSGYLKLLLEWERRAETAFRKNIGVVRGGVTHYWHGKMHERRYGLRNRILVENRFDPYRDLKRDTQGVCRLHDDGSERFVRLRDDLRSYFMGAMRTASIRNL